MWQSTLLVFSSDNGGPSQLGKECNASNYPLRGGKSAAWDGGHRVVAFASGGLIPTPMRGRVLDGYIHMADWYPLLGLYGIGIQQAYLINPDTLPRCAPHPPPRYPTFCRLGAVPAADNPAGLPGLDGIDVWPYLSGAAAASPRTEVALGQC